MNGVHFKKNTGYKTTVCGVIADEKTYFTTSELTVSCEECARWLISTKRTELEKLERIWRNRETQNVSA